MRALTVINSADCLFATLHKSRSRWPALAKDALRTFRQSLAGPGNPKKVARVMIEKFAGDRGRLGANFSI
ncbi:MAG: hypothetical protein F9K29_10490 [Hyphomicrobiaceae bacterium]|nr:MAG: hypothetical protein F9K29_10490 [Hyphomicrobiaceae bacterium]